MSIQLSYQGSVNIYQTWKWLKIQWHVHDLLCFLCDLNMWILGSSTPLCLVSPLSVILHWKSASNYCNTIVPAAQGIGRLTCILGFLSSVYIRTHHITSLVPVTLCSPTPISDKHWSRNFSLTLFRACWLWAPPCETWRGVLHAVRSHHLSCSGGPQKWTACDIKSWFILVGILGNFCIWRELQFVTVNGWIWEPLN